MSEGEIHSVETGLLRQINTLVRFNHQLLAALTSDEGLTQETLTSLLNLMLEVIERQDQILNLLPGMPDER